MKYAELSDEAKERARAWWKDLEAQDWGSARAPDLYPDMATCLSFLGISVDMTPHTRRNGTYSAKFAFEWSGFWSQGDGLVFSGDWSAESVDLDKLMEHAPLDETLRSICTGMTALKLRYPQATCRITTISTGHGLPRMDLEDTMIGGDADDGMLELPGDYCRVLGNLVRDACNWCYNNLQDNYEYDTGDEAAAESIEANEYDFDEDGGFMTPAQMAAGV